MKKGVVIKSTGSWYDVKLEKTHEVIQARIKGKFRLGNLKLTNPVAVGDIVEIEILKDKTAIIHEIAPRRNYVIRQSPRKKHYVHFLASNIDLAILVITIVEPKLKQGFIDRFLLMTEPYDIPVHIVFNKCDLYSEEDMEVFEYLKAVYENIGYAVHLVSAEKNIGIDDFAEILKDKTTLISGQSGVGKSTFINALIPDLGLRTTGISDYSGKGQHTTTFAQMYELQEGASIIDTPGIKTLSFNHLEVMDVAHNFREFFIVSEDCKFGNCSHRNEPKCAVKRAIENGEISELRYANYMALIVEIEDQNYWELNTDY